MALLRPPGYLTLLAGHAPTGPGEIVLGAETHARACTARLGQDRAGRGERLHRGAHGPQRARTMRVVGEAVFPDFGLPALSDTDLGNGALGRDARC